MSTKTVKSVFTDYLNTSNTSYALLINGVWGSGKTHFWKHELSAIAQDKNRIPIYISLNGVNNLEIIDYHFALAIVTSIANDKLGVTTKPSQFVANLTGIASKYLLKASLSEILKNVDLKSLKLEKYVICFDDLERCLAPTKEVLGFINDYVEHKNVKVVILADEQNILDKSKAYDSIKEKVVGRIINFQSRIEEILPVLFTSYRNSNSEFLSFLKQHESYISSILVEYNQSNLRIVTFYLQTLEKLFPVLHSIRKEYQEEVIFFAAIISIEFRLGKLNSADVNDVKGIESSSKMFGLAVRNSLKGMKGGEQDESYAMYFYKTYLGNRLQVYTFYNSVYQYILSGHLDIITLEKELQDRIPETHSIEEQKYNKLITYKFRYLSDDQFEEYLEDVFQYGCKGKYKIYDYPNLLHFYLYFSQNGMINLPDEEIGKKLLEGLHIAKQHTVLDYGRLDNILHFKDENPIVENMKMEVKAVHVAMEDVALSELINELPRTLTEGGSLIEFFPDNHDPKPIFKNINREQLFLALTLSSNEQLYAFLKAMESRYKVMNIGKYLYEDEECLSDVLNKLQDHINNASLRPLNKFAIQSLIEGLQKICEKLSTTKNQTTFVV